MGFDVKHIANCTLYRGDVLEVVGVLPPESLDAIVTDPPYGLTFMGKEWDGSDGFRRSLHGADVRKENVCAAPQPMRADNRWQPFQAWCETWACACLRVLKPGGHLVAFGGSRTYHRLACAIEDAGFEIRDQIMWLYGSGFPKNLDVSKRSDTMTPSASEEAKRWDGWGTALKPAHEPIVLARKPLIRTVADNLQRYDVDGHRSWFGTAAEHRSTPPHGRWPANVIHDGSDEVCNLFPRITTTHIDKASLCNTTGVTSFDAMRGKRPARGYDGEGSAARFFYTAKASPSERGEGLPQGIHNDHPTVKPVALMRYLVQLVTPAGGCVLDPLMGSGTTGCACAALGHAFIGIEREPSYFDIACWRIEAATRQLSLFDPSGFNNYTME
jgi:site-specific DNA-methyltransferase (adenine-specific)